jgi:DNA-binding transcriptional ArsR family regulator
MRRKNALANVGMSKVFYSILNGSTTSKAISQELKITPPSVMEQLHRLRKVKLVKHGKKDGKYQYYEVDSEGLATLFLNEPIFNLRQIIRFTDSDYLKEQLTRNYWEFLTAGKDLTKDDIVPTLTLRLYENRLWVKYLLTYLKCYASPAVTSLGARPLLEAVRSFDEGVRVKCFKILGEFHSETWNQLDVSKKELLKLLHIWSILLHKGEPINEAAHSSAIREMVGYEIMNRIEGR